MRSVPKGIIMGPYGMIKDDFLRNIMILKQKGDYQLQENEREEDSRHTRIIFQRYSSRKELGIWATERSLLLEQLPLSSRYF